MRVMVEVGGCRGRENRMMSTIPPAGFILDYDEESENCTGMERGFCLFLSSNLSLLLPSLVFVPCCSSLGQQKHLEMKWVSLWQVYEESLPVLEAFLENT